MSRERTRCGSRNRFMDTVAIARKTGLCAPYFSFAPLLREPLTPPMVKITGDYQGELHCGATHGPSGETLSTDAPKDNQGRGEAFSPTDLTATSLATCVLTTMAIAARRHGVELNGARFEVTKEMAPQSPRRIARLACQFWLPIQKSVLPPGFLEQAAANCPVSLSLHPEIEKPVTLHWAE